MMAAVAAVFGTMSCKKDNVPSMNQGNANVPVDGERTEHTGAIPTVSSVLSPSAGTFALP